MDMIIPAPDVEISRLANSFVMASNTPMLTTDGLLAVPFDAMHHLAVRAQGDTNITSRRSQGAHTTNRAVAQQASSPYALRDNASKRMFHARPKESVGPHQGKASERVS